MEEPEYCPQHGYPSPCEKCCFGCKRIELPTPGSKEWGELKDKIVPLIAENAVTPSSGANKILSLLAKGGK